MSSLHTVRPSERLLGGGAPGAPGQPGAVATELASHNRPEIREGLAKRFADIERLEAHDIAEAVAFIVTRPRHVAVNEVLIRPTEQQQ